MLHFLGTDPLHTARYVHRTVSPKREGGWKDIFDRDPLVAKFTFLGKTGAPKNDLVVVGLHLAALQTLVNNHNRAMDVVRTKLHELTASGALPPGERDFVIMGDFNASRYDNKVEDFWTNYDASGFSFVTLSPDDGEEYPGTRLVGVPLIPASKIDYIITSGMTGGLSSKLVQLMAEVHKELLPSDFNLFREHVSDHMPVTVRAEVVPDDD